ncbi:exocyst complex component sec6 [Sarcoptes scabiei]|nr:exocyst complex component sec6 [Sarcoptes scabiei]
MLFSLKSLRNGDCFCSRYDENRQTMFYCGFFTTVAGFIWFLIGFMIRCAFFAEAFGPSVDAVACGIMVVGLMILIIGICSTISIVCAAKPNNRTGCLVINDSGTYFDEIGSKLTKQYGLFPDPHQQHSLDHDHRHPQQQHNFHYDSHYYQKKKISKKILNIGENECGTMRIQPDDSLCSSDLNDLSTISSTSSSSSSSPPSSSRSKENRKISSLAFINLSSSSARSSSSSNNNTNSQLYQSDIAMIA